MRTRSQLAKLVPLPKGVRRNKAEQYGIMAYSFLVACKSNHLEAVKSFVKQGVDIHCFDDCGLYLACKHDNLPIVEYLVQQGMDVNATCSKYGHPFQAAIKFGHYNIVKYLIEHGANVDNRALLLEAISSNRPKIAHLLISHMNVMLIKENIALILSFACYNASLAIFLLLNRKQIDYNLYKNNILLVASYCGHENIVKYILCHGAKNIVGNLKYDALWYACTNGHEGVVKILLDFIEPGGVNHHHLHTASINNHNSITRLLLERIKINIR